MRDTEFYMVLKYLNNLQEGVYKYRTIEEICTECNDRLHTKSTKKTIEATIDELYTEGYIWKNKENKAKINIRGRYFISKIDEEAENNKTLLEYSKNMNYLTWVIAILTLILLICAIVQIIIVLK